MDQNCLVSIPFCIGGYSTCLSVSKIQNVFSSLTQGKIVPGVLSHYTKCDFKWEQSVLAILTHHLFLYGKHDDILSNPIAHRNTEIHSVATFLT